MNAISAHDKSVAISGHNTAEMISADGETDSDWYRVACETLLGIRQ